MTSSLLTFLTFLLFSLHVLAQENDCEKLNDRLDLTECEHNNSPSPMPSVTKSLPSAAAASQLNPASLGTTRGFGIETFYQKNNPLNFSLVTGTGKIGAALVNTNIENSFFGNRTPEVESEYYVRKKENKLYRSNKYALALGGALFNRPSFGLDIGFMGKYHKDVKDINPGMGVALRMGFLSFGGAMYKDNYFLKLPSGDAQETYNVQNLFVGLKFLNLHIDYGQIKTTYDSNEEDALISLYSTSLAINKFLFNLAYRNENSFLMDDQIEKLSDIETEDYYGGIQYSLNQFMNLGAHYNYYLLDEFAFNLTIFI